MTRPGTHGNDPRREPLDAAERELAERLARLGPHGEPPVEVDARILAAAHAASNATPRRARRLPLAVGVAASLVLALGLAWQLRPLLDPPPPPESSSMDMATRPAVELAPKAAAASSSEAGSEAGSSEAGAQENGASEEQHDARSAAPDRAQAEAELSTAEPSASPAPSARRRAQVEAPAAFPTAPFPPPPAPPPAPAPPAGPAARTTAPAAPAPIAETQAADAADAGMRRRAAESQRHLDRGETGEGQAMQESTAAADGADAQEAEAYLRQIQLERIRALRDAGRTAQARDELDAFLARWPGYPLPDDLLPLRR